MKKSGLLVIITVLLLVTTIILAGCMPTQQITGIEVKNPKIVFNLNEEFQIGADAVYNAIIGKEKNAIKAADTEYETTYDKTKQGIYDVTLYYQNKEFSYQYKVVVLDYSTLTAEKGSLLNSISFNQSLCLSWKNGTEVLDSAGTVNYIAIFQPDGNSAIEVSLPVTVTAPTLPEKQNNEWTAELTIENWTYGESPSVPSASAKSGTVEFTYYTNNNGTKGDQLENAPTDAGNYIVVASVAESEEYNALSAEKTFVINKATLSISANTSLNKYQNIRKYYDGSYALDSQSFFTAADYYTLSCATVTDLSGINIIAVGNGTFVNKTTNEPDKNIGEKYVLQSVEINSANFVNFAFSGGNQYTNISFEGLIEKGEPATIETNPVSSAVFENDALSKSSISGGKVTYSLCAQEDSTAATSTELNGVWTWQNPETILTESSSHTAKFIPADTNIDPVMVNIPVEVQINDNSVIKINIGSGEQIEAEREGNSFSYEVPFDTDINETLYAELILGVNVTFANYKLYFGNTLNSEKAENEQIGVSIENLNNYPAITVEYTIIGQDFGERILTLTLTFQQPVTFKVNGESLNSDTFLNVGDIIDITKMDSSLILYLNSQSTEIEILQGVASGTYTVTENNIGNTLLFTISYADGQEKNYYFQVENLFSSVTVNETTFNTDNNTYYYDLDANQTSLTFTFNNPATMNYSLSITYKNIYGKYLYINIGNTGFYTLSISEIQEISISNNSSSIYFDFTLYLNNFTYIEEISATTSTGPIEEQNGIMQSYNAFVENISVTLKDGYSDYRYEITDENGNAFDLKNVKMINKFLVKIYSGADESSLVETKEYIIKYDFVLQTDNSSYVYTDYADEMFPMYFFESENDTENVTFTLLDNEFKNYTLEFLNEDGELLSPQTVTLLNGRNSYIVRIISGEYKFEDRLELFFFSSSPHNFISNITYNFIDNSESNNNIIYTSEIHYYTVYIPVIHSIDYFVSLLNYDILNGYTANATYLSELECVYIEIKDSNDSVVSGLLIHIEFEGIANDDISFTASRLNDISLESTPIEKDSSDIYVVSNILFSEQIFIDTANPYILIELYKNSVADENLLAKYYGSVSMSSSGIFSEMIDGTYIIKITSTDKSQSETLTFNITFKEEAFLYVEIGDFVFNVLMEQYMPVADSSDWELEFDQNLQTFKAHINESILPNGDTIEALIIPMSGYNISDFSGNLVSSDSPYSFNILTENETGKKYFCFKMLTVNIEMHVYVYFDFEPLINLTVANNEFTAVMNQFEMSFNTSENWNMVFDNEREMIVANLPATLISADDTDFTLNINLKDGYTLSDTEGATLTEGENTFELKTDSELKKYIEFNIIYEETPVPVNVYFDFSEIA